jgi:replicative DNA helicase
MSTYTRSEVLAVGGRVPPNDLPAERAVISTLLVKPEALDEVSSILKPEHFYAEAHDTIYGAILSLASAGTPVDLVTVGGWLHTKELLNRVGGTAYLADVIDQTPSVRNVLEHARIVVRKARMRRLIREAHTIAAEGYGDVGDEDEWVESAEQRLAAVADAADVRTVETIGTALTKYWESYRAEIEGGREVEGARFGVSSLDEILWPLRSKRVTILGGFPGDGKTSLGLQAAVATARERRASTSAALVISAEMGSEELAMRALFGHAGVDSSKARPGHHDGIGPNDWSALTGAASMLTPLPVYIDDRAGISIDEIAPSVRRHKALAARAGHVLRLVVVDYLQLIDGPLDLAKKRDSNREQAVASVSKGLKRLAKSCDVHVLALAQLNDDASKRGKDDQKPTAKDFRESKAIWANADNCVLIYNEHVRQRARAKANGENVRASLEESCELIVDKHRGGRTGTADAKFLPALTLFVDP